MKRLVTLLLTAGMLLGAASGASAIDFKAKGQWIFGFGALDATFSKTEGQGSGGDTFSAMQRVRLQIEAIASESLSGTVMFEIGDTRWGRNNGGGALGADQTVIELRGAYIDWVVPSTEVKVRMGIQPIAFPSVAGGPAILDDMTAGIVVSTPFNDMFGLTAVWARPYNDNFTTPDAGIGAGRGQNSANYLDNVDIFALMLPVAGENWKVTPWASVSMIGRNAVSSLAQAVARDDSADGNAAGMVVQGMLPAWTAPGTDDSPYATAFFAGLPMAFTFDNFNVELDLNYGSVTGYGEAGDGASTNRSGWLIKGLFEYRMDWGTPGLFAWYGSGDDGNERNGSESMPFIDPAGYFTSFMGDGEMGWSIVGNGAGYDNMLAYSGTWGIGAQIKNLSFVEDLSHILRVAYWGGTNSTEMAQFVGNTRTNGGFYLTKKDSLFEVNVDSTYQIYENFQAVLQLGYIANGLNGSRDVWGDAIDVKTDAYRAALLFNYSF